MIVTRKTTRASSYLCLLLVFGIFISTTSSSHIDDTNGVLSNFSFDRVVFKLRKDCSLDKIPEVKRFLDEETVKYPKLEVYLSEGDPRFELFKEGKLVDTIRAGRYDVPGFRRLLHEFGI